MSHRARLRIPTPAPFDWALSVRGHGWYQLAPMAWDSDARELSLATEHAGDVVDLRLRHDGQAIRGDVQSHAPLSRQAVMDLRRKVARMFRLDEDLREFWALCRRTPRLTWVARLGAGRLLRAPSLFEDQLKIIFTTNCTWHNTRQMSARVVELMGPESPSGRRAFPSAARAARRGEGFWRDRVRVGYRVPACRWRGREGRHDDAHLHPAHEVGGEADTPSLRRALQRRPGFGPYAAGQALRLLGRYDDLALDSAVRARLSGPGGDRALARRYASFGPHAGLALWMDFCRAWLDHPGVPRG